MIYQWHHFKHLSVPVTKGLHHNLLSLSALVSLLPCWSCCLGVELRALQPILRLWGFTPLPLIFATLTHLQSYFCQHLLGRFLFLDLLLCWALSYCSKSLFSSVLWCIWCRKQLPHGRVPHFCQHWRLKPFTCHGGRGTTSFCKYSDRAVDVPWDFMGEEGPAS